MLPKIDAKGYCVDCDSHHTCITCSRMNQYMSDFVDRYREKLTKIVDVLDEQESIMTPEEIAEENRVFRESKNKERRVY